MDILGYLALGVRLLGGFSIAVGLVILAGAIAMERTGHVTTLSRSQTSSRSSVCASGWR